MIVEIDEQTDANIESEYEDVGGLNPESEHAAIGEYEHYKGGRYRVMCEANSESDGQRMVVYRKADTCTVFVRTLKSFGEQITVNGESRPRFRRIPTMTDDAEIKGNQSVKSSTKGGRSGGRNSNSAQASS